VKAPTSASLKKVNAENLSSLGADRLARILTDVAATRPDLKRRLRMELAAKQGPEHLAAEIDKRLASLATSRGKIGWRQRPAFVRDLDALRGLITERLSELDRPAGLTRLWEFLDTARQVGPRSRDREGAVDAVFARAAADAGRLIDGLDPQMAAVALVDAMVRNPAAWAHWLPGLLSIAPAATSHAALHLISGRSGATPGWFPLVRQLADAAGEVDAYRATYKPEALATRDRRRGRGAVSWRRPDRGSGRNPETCGAETGPANWRRPRARFPLGNGLDRLSGARGPGSGGAGGPVGVVRTHPVRRSRPSLYRPAGRLR